MRIGLINVVNLSRVRRTFRPGWRIFITLTFLFFVCLWWGAINRIQDLAQVLTDGSLRLRTLILAGMLLPALIVALFRKDDFARLIFALVTVFTALSILPFLLAAVYAVVTMSGQDVAIMVFALMFLLLALALYWDFLIRHSYALCLSLMPFSRLKAYRQQVIHCLRLWAGQWKGLDESQVSEAGEKPYPISGAFYRLTLGGISFVLGMVSFALAFFGLINAEFFPAIYHLEFSRAWDMLRNLQTTPPGPSWDTFGAELLVGMNSVFVALFGVFFFFVFGYFLTQWQRENISVYRIPLLQHMTPSDVLLLRSFKDDVKFVGRAKNRFWMMPFTIYGWSFTFEQLIVNRLQYLGKVRLLDVEHENREFLDKWESTGFDNLLDTDKLRKLLILIFPALWYKLPAKGGIRYYVDDQGDEKKWQEDVEKAMSIARMIIVVLGTTPSLKWEMDKIEHRHFSEKTVFVMPPLILKRNYRTRWQQFIDYVCETRACDKGLLEKVDPKRVLAVCVHEQALVIITGKGNSQLLYESAVDVATILTVADSSQSSKMIPKYLT